jgi:hypothetical protein
MVAVILVRPPLVLLRVLYLVGTLCVARWLFDCPRIQPVRCAHGWVLVYRFLQRGSSFAMAVGVVDPDGWKDASNVGLLIRSV